jgi:glycosyltransferase involved in cell wall biosynthesis
MFLTTEHRHSTASTLDAGTAEHAAGVAMEEGRALAKGKAEPPPRPEVLPPAVNYHAQCDEGGPVLAVFCYEDPGSAIGRFVGELIASLARRGVTVHLFARTPFEQDATGIAEHVLGGLDGDDLLAQVQEFTHHACNAFLQHFPNGAADISLMGFEWSSVQALSILRGIKNLEIIWSLHSLERQRSDVSSEVAKRIEEIELSGLREAKTILVHEPATAEVAKECVPECGARITCLRQRFPAEFFATPLDPGAIKARYQVGPVDPTILFVGDLTERNGPDLLIKAMPAVLKNHPQARLVIVGDGTLYWPLRVYTRYLLLEHAVRMIGHLEGQPLHELIQAADVVAVPSREQTPWWPILAAWAAGRPVVATHQAAAGLLEHEQDSVLCYPSENSCVWGIERVLYDPELARRLTETGMRNVEVRFGWNVLAAQVEELMGLTQVR